MLLIPALVFVLFSAAGAVEKHKPGIFPTAYEIKIDLGSPQGEPPHNLYKEYDRKRIREAVAKDPKLQKQVKRIASRAHGFASMPDDEIRALFLPADTHRDFVVNRHGCPICGGADKVYEPFGQGVSLSYPRQVRCRKCGAIFPNEDFPDDGQGWLDTREGSPTKGQKFYFLGWWQHWFLLSVPQRIHNLATAWFFTDKDIYAHKAKVMLNRFMEIYPDIDTKDLTYCGGHAGLYVKMTGTYWEGPRLLILAEAVELLAPALSEQDLENIYYKIYRPGFEAYRAKPAPTNWGNCWNAAFAKFALVTGDDEFLQYMLKGHPVAVLASLDNQLMRDGVPYESSFSYGRSYLKYAMTVADVLGPKGEAIWGHPHLRKAYHAFAELICLDKYSHNYGDTGSIFNKGKALRTHIIEAGYHAYKEPIIARYLLQSYKMRDIDPDEKHEKPSVNQFFEDEKTIDADELRRVAALAKPLKSTLAPVRGFAILRTGAGDNRTALFMDYGYAHPAHGHADRLNINIFTADREIIPEIGYPEFMDTTAPGTGGWAAHTVSHATVEVDEKRQLESTFGDLHGFVNTEDVKYMDASCEDAYVHCGVDLYRRAMLLMDVPGGAYVVDIFRVAGARQHDYLFHGPTFRVKEPNGPNEPFVDFKLKGIQLGEPQKQGTLAGKDKPFGTVPEGMVPYCLQYGGYQFLFDVRRAEIGEPYSATWNMYDGVALNATFVPDKTETFLLTKGYPKPSSKSLPTMPFLVRRIRPESDKDISKFVSVFSVDSNCPPLIKSAKKIPLSIHSDPSGCAIMIEHRFGKDLILSTDSTYAKIESADGRFKLEGQLGVASWRDGKLEKLTLIGAKSITVGEETLQISKAAHHAEIRQVFDYKLVLNKCLPCDTAGRVLLVDRGPVRSAYRIENVYGETVYVSPTTWIGRGSVDSINAQAARIVDNRGVFPLGDYLAPHTWIGNDRFGTIPEYQKYPTDHRNYYHGSWMTDAKGERNYRLIKGGNDEFIIDRAQDLSHLEEHFPEKSEFLLYDLGPGDTVTLLNCKTLSYN